MVAYMSLVFDSENLLEKYSILESVISLMTLFF